MLRKLVVGAGVALTAMCSPIALGAGVAAAAPPNVTLSGAINCTANGQLKFSQALTNTNPNAQVTVSVTVKLKKCTGPGTISAPVTLTHGSLTASSTTTMLNACGTISSATPLPTMNGTINWKGTKGTVTASAVTIQGATGFYDQGANELHVGLPTSIDSGSFAGQSTSFTGLDSNKPAYNLTSTCSGSHGLKGFTIGHPGSTLTGSLAIVGG